jgi:hypothetical protein
MQHDDNRITLPHAKTVADVAVAARWATWDATRDSAFAPSPALVARLDRLGVTTLSALTAPQAKDLVGVMIESLALRPMGEPMNA